MFLENLKKIIKNLYTDVGKKIMNIAKATGIFYLFLGLLSAVVIFFMGIFDPYSFGAYFFVAIGCPFAGVVMYCTTLPIYGFGKMIDDISAMRRDGSSGAKASDISVDDLPTL